MYTVPTLYTPRYDMSGHLIARNGKTKLNTGWHGFERFGHRCLLAETGKVPGVSGSGKNIHYQKVPGERKIGTHQ